MHLFYTPDIAGDEYCLGEEESRHAAGVLRLRPRQRVRLTDGRGGWFLAEVMPGATPKACRVQVVERGEGPGKRPYRLHIALAPTKSIDRYEWFLEKATEIGVDAITPLDCAHSERRVVKAERSLRVVTAAMKQSQKAWLLLVNDMTAFSQFIGRDFGTAKKFIAHCEKDVPKILLQDAVLAGEDCVVLIGPEGDFSPEEIARAREAGYTEISLGESRLRTETAGVVTCSMLQFVNR